MGISSCSQAAMTGRPARRRHRRARGPVACAIEFLHTQESAAESHGDEEFYSTVDILVIGRKTYETARAFDQWPYGRKPVVVLSSSDLAPAPTGAVVERMSG